MKLVACSQCHAQYDVSAVEPGRFECRCGETVEVRDLRAVDATIRRCGSCGAIVSAGARQCEYCTSEIVHDPSDLSLICPECYARNADASRFCTACGVAFKPQPLPRDDRELPCPCCGGLMRVRALDGIAILECPGCHGLWAPEGRFEHLVQRAIEAQVGPEKAGPPAEPRVTGANPSMRVVYRRCPECEALMHRSNFRKRSGVIIDVCHAHGTWLDADELEQIAGFIASGGLAQAQAIENEQAASALRRDACRSAYAARTGAPEASSEAGIMTTVVELFQMFLT